MDLSDRRWAPRASLPTSRHDMRCFTADGDVLVVSGADERTYETTPTYDPAVDAWRRERAPIPTARGWYGAARIDGDGIYVAGGKRVRGSFLDDGIAPQYDVFARLERYDVATDRWERLAPLPEPRAGLSAAVVDGKFYAVGGMAPPSDEAFAGLHDDSTVTGYHPLRQPWTETDQIDIYDPSTDSWESGTSLPAPRMAPGVECIDGKLYVFGGYRGDSFFDEVYRLDPGSGDWESLAPMRTRRRDFPTVAEDGTVYVFGGLRAGARVRDDGAEIERYTAACEMYDVAADEWSPLPDLPRAKAWSGATFVGDRLFVVGGAYRPDYEFEFTDEVHELVGPT